MLLSAPTVCVTYSVNSVLHGVTIVAGFPCKVERIPRTVVVNEGVNFEHLANPIVRHIYVGIVVINPGTHFVQNSHPGLLHLGGVSEDGDGHNSVRKVLETGG